MLIIIIKNKKINDSIRLFSLDANVSERKVKTIARKKEPIPTKKMYLPETVDLLLPKKVTSCDV